MRRYHRPFDPKEYKESLKMFRRISEILRTLSDPIPLLVPDGEMEQTEEERKRIFVERHNEQRNDMHFRLGWPWGELPTANTAWEATERLLATEPYVQTKEGNH